MKKIKIWRRNIINKYFRRELIKCIIKDYVIMQMYFNNFDKIDQIIEYDKNGNIVHGYYDKKQNENGWNFDEIIEYVTTLITSYSKSYEKYCFSKKQVEKALQELIADRFLMRSNPDKNKILFAQKGLAQHINGRSFEADYRKDKRERFAILIAILSFIISTISIIISIIISIGCK